MFRFLTIEQILDLTYRTITLKPIHIKNQKCPLDCSYINNNSFVHKMIFASELLWQTL